MAIFKVMLRKIKGIKNIPLVSGVAECLTITLICLWLVSTEALTASEQQNNTLTIKFLAVQYYKAY